MPPLNHTETFTTVMSPGAARERVLAWFADYKPRVAADTPEYLDVKTGSQLKMRLIGGFFLRASSLPVTTRVTFEPGSSATKVTVVAEDTVMIGLKTGMKKKYQGWLEEIGAGLRASCT